MQAKTKYSGKRPLVVAFAVLAAGALFFAGCKNSAGGEENSGNALIQKEPVKLEMCEVKFDANGGLGTMFPQLIVKGEAKSLNLQKDFQHEGATFLGWSESKDATEAEYGDGASYTVPATADDTITLYAVWQTNAAVSRNAYAPVYNTVASSATNSSVTVTWHKNGGTGSNDDQSQGAWMIIPDSRGSTLEGHCFAGWNTKADGSGSWFYPGLEFTFTTDLTLYARWKPEAAAVAVVTKADGSVSYFSFLESAFRLAAQEPPGSTLQLRQSVPFGGIRIIGWTNQATGAETRADFTLDFNGCTVTKEDSGVLLHLSSNPDSEGFVKVRLTDTKGGGGLKANHPKSWCIANYRSTLDISGNIVIEGKMGGIENGGTLTIGDGLSVRTGQTGIWTHSVLNMSGNFSLVSSDRNYGALNAGNTSTQINVTAPLTGPSFVTARNDLSILAAFHENPDSEGVVVDSTIRGGEGYTLTASDVEKFILLMDTFDMDYWLSPYPDLQEYPSLKARKGKKYNMTLHHDEASDSIKIRLTPR